MRVFLVYQLFDGNIVATLLLALWQEKELWVCIKFSTTLKQIDGNIFATVFRFMASGKFVCLSGYHHKRDSWKDCHLICRLGITGRILGVFKVVA